MRHLIHIGTQKAGSTFLWSLLRQHPDISVSKIQECNFFHNNYLQGTGWYNGQFDARKPFFLDTSPVYFRHGAEIAERILNFSGTYDVSLTLLLRNPVDYLASHFLMQKNQGFFETSLKYRNAPGNLVDFVETHPEYLERAFYARNLKENWLPRFPNRLKIFLFEDFVANPEATLRDILNFYGARTDIAFDFAQTEQNRASKNSSALALRRAGARLGVARQWFRPLWRGLGLKKAFTAASTKDSAKTLSSIDRERLAAVLKDDVTRLKGLIGVENLPWKDFR